MGAPAPPERPTTRGIGVLAGVLTFAAVGVADGVLALVRSPAGAIAGRLFPVVVFQCVATLLSVGLAFGVGGEALLEAGRRVPLAARFGRWFAGGPRRWFARDPVAAHGTLAALGAAVLVVGPVFPAALWILEHFHSAALSALAIACVVVALLGVAGVVATLSAPPVRWCLVKLGPVASPGSVVALAVALVAGQCAWFYRLNETWLRNLEWGAASLVLVMLLANAGALGALGAWRLRRGRPLGARAVGPAALVAVLGFAAAGLTFGARQTVAATVFLRSELTGYLVRVLQNVTDTDRDGYSALFNGGDCDDRDPRVHPAALDVPGNGRDENCSGSDARAAREEGDGFLAPTSGLALAEGARPSILMLSIDALRPDHMSFYGYHRPTTPNLDAFARGAAHFTRAYCASPRSLRSFAAIWTGRYASQVEWGEDNQFPPLEASNVTLAERLRDHGYATAAFNNSNYFSRTEGFYQGFDEHHETRGFKDDVAPVAEHVARWMRERAAADAPFFAWVHLLEPHEPYRDLTTPRDFGHRPIDQYDEEVARADLAARTILDAADAIAARRPLIVIVMGDHGEAFNEHGWEHHSYDLHEEAVRVPLIIRGPGIAAGPRAPLASLIDLHPTVLNWVGLRPEGPLAGRSLVRPLGDPAMPAVGGAWREHLYAEVTPDGLLPFEQKTLIAYPYKILWDVRRGTWELFDLRRDPGEARNLYDDRPDVALRLRGMLRAWVEAVGGGGRRNQDVIARARLARVPPMQTPVGVRYGDVVELLGYDVESRRVPLRGVVRLSFYVRPLSRTHENHWLTVWFQPYDRQPIWPGFRASHYPIHGAYPTTRWVPGEVLRDDVVLHVEPEMRPARLRIMYKVEGPGHVRAIPPSARGFPDGSVYLGDLEIVP